METNSGSLNPVGKLLVVLFGMWLLHQLSRLFAESTNVPPEIATLQIYGGAFLIMFVLGALSYRYYRKEDPGDRKFGIGTLMLLMVPIAVYAAVFGQILKSIDSPITLYGMVIAGSFMLFFAVVFTFLLLHMTDAFVWFGASCLRMVRWLMKRT